MKSAAVVNREAFLTALAISSIALPSVVSAAPKADDSKASLKPAMAQPEKTPSRSNPIDSKVFDKTMSDGPTNIVSDTLTLKNKDRVFVYSGNVKVTQGEMTLTTKALEGTYSEENQIQRMVARGDVIITKGEIKATGGQALYDAATATVTLTDSPQVEQNGSILTADRIKVFMNEDRSQAEGQVRVTLVKKKDEGSSASAAAAAAATPGEGTPAAVPTRTPTPTPIPR